MVGEKAHLLATESPMIIPFVVESEMNIAFGSLNASYPVGRSLRRRIQKDLDHCLALLSSRTYHSMIADQFTRQTAEKSNSSVDLESVGLVTVESTDRVNVKSAEQAIAETVGQIDRPSTPFFSKKNINAFLTGAGRMCFGYVFVRE